MTGKEVVKSVGLAIGTAPSAGMLRVLQALEPLSDGEKVVGERVFITTRNSRDIGVHKSVPEYFDVALTKYLPGAVWSAPYLGENPVYWLVLGGGLLPEPCLAEIYDPSIEAYRPGLRDLEVTIDPGQRQGVKVSNAGTLYVLSATIR